MEIGETLGREVPDERMLTARAVKRRKKYLFAAIRSIRRWGAREATMDLIAAEAGVTRATIYREFNNRRELFSAVTAFRFESFCNRFFRRVDPLLPLPDKLEAFFMGSVLLALRNPVTRGLVRGSLDFTSPGTPLHSIALKAWRPSLQNVTFAENLETLDYEDIVQWILVSQFTLCKLALDTQLSIPRLRRYIRSFVTPAFGTYDAVTISHGRKARGIL